MYIPNPSAETAFDLSKQMIGSRLRTKQTSEEGLEVRKVYVAEKVKYNNEFYLSIAMDRDNSRPAMIASRYGGVDIEALAARDNNSVVRLPVDYQEGITEEVATQVAKALSLDQQTQIQDLHTLLGRLYGLFKSSDATLVEINPLVLTASGKLVCLDSKFNIDNAARFRQPELFALEDKSSSSKDALERQAERLGFAYVRLEGNIGNIVNGAGLAMATNDAVNHFGGNCANFLDAGGRATKETMADAFRVVLSDERVKVIFINIYGGTTLLAPVQLCYSLTLVGIIHGDMVARSIVEGVQEIGPLRVPMVVRLQGTRSAEGQQMVGYMYSYLLYIIFY